MDYDLDARRSPGTFFAFGAGKRCERVLHIVLAMGEYRSYVLQSLRQVGGSDVCPAAPQ